MSAVRAPQLRWALGLAAGSVYIPLFVLVPIGSFIRGQRTEPPRMSATDLLVHNLHVGAVLVIGGIVTWGLLPLLWAPPGGA